MIRLFTWLTISDDELKAVGVDMDGAGHAEILLIKDLLRWCLKARPEDRPSMEQVLVHPLFNGTAAALAAFPSIRPMQYLFFLSHQQKNAASTAKALYYMLSRLGVHCWYDVMQAHLTPEGMMQGIADSCFFLAILSQDYLKSRFCRSEFLKAIRLGKPIILVIEREGRFFPFDEAAWYRGDMQTSFPAGTADVQAAITAAIDAHLPNAVSYRRRDFEG